MNIKEITIGTFLKFAGKIGFKSSKISQKIIAMCEPEIAKICTNPDLLKSSTVSRSISVRSARIIPLVNSLDFSESLAWSIFCKTSKRFCFIFSDKVRFSFSAT